MGTVNNTTPCFFSRACEFTKNVSHKLSRTFTHVDGMDKFMKCANSISDVYTYFRPDETLSIVHSQFKGATNMFGALNLINRVKEWVVTEERQKFLKTGKATAMKVLFTVSNFFETVKYGDILKLYDLGFANATKVFIPVLERTVELSPIAIAKDLCAMTAMVINLTEADVLVVNGRTDYTRSEIDVERFHKAELKKRTALALSEADRSGSRGAQVEQLSRIDNPSRLQYIGHKRMIAEIKGIGLPANANDIYGEEWMTFIHNDQKLNRASQSGQKIENFWKIGYDVHSSTWIKSALSIASDLSKVLIITTAIVGLTILGIKTSAFMVPFLLGAAATASIGYVKFLFDDWYKQKQAAWNEAASLAGLSLKAVVESY